MAIINNLSLIVNTAKQACNITFELNKFPLTKAKNEALASLRCELRREINLIRTNLE